jgi:excisionase family DNA binding protein
MILKYINPDVVDAYTKAKQAYLQELIRDAVEQARKDLAVPRNNENNANGPNLSVKEAAQFSRVAPSTIRLMIRKGVLPAQRIGRRVIVKRDDLESAMRRTSASRLH